MFKLAWRQLKLEKTRSLLTGLALGAVIAVILFLKGFEQGQYYQLEQIILHRNADLVASQAGITNFVAARSSIPQLARAQVESVNGVVNAHPLTAIPIIYNRDNKRTPVYVLVYDTRGGPSTIVKGRHIEDGREIVIDTALAKKYDLQIGDQFMVTDFEFTIAGITQEAAFMMPFAFINYDGMVDLFIESEIAPDLSTFPLLSYMLIELEKGADSNRVLNQIEESVPDVDVMTPQQLANNDVTLGRVFFAPIMGLLVGVGYIIGLMVVGLIMYADVRSRIRNFAVFKALGFRFKHLFNAVFCQSLLLLIIAIPIGLILVQSLTLFVHANVPVYLIRSFDTVILTQTLFATVAIAILGSLVPLRMIHRTDPVLAFQGEH